MNAKKIILITLILALFAGAGVFAYTTYVQEDIAEETAINTEDSVTQESVTYENQEYGFSFSYPSDWTIEESTASISLLSPKTQEDRVYSETTPADITFHIVSSPQDLDYVESSDILNDLSESPVTEIQYENGVYSFIQKNEFLDEDQYTFYAELQNSYFLSYSYILSSSEKASIEKIINSIEFDTDFAYKDAPEGWLTYENSKYNFGLFYPEASQVFNPCADDLSCSISTQNLYHLRSSRDDRNPFIRVTKEEALEERDYIAKGEGEDIHVLDSGIKVKKQISLAEGGAIASEYYFYTGEYLHTIRFHIPNESIDDDFLTPEKYLDTDKKLSLIEDLKQGKAQDYQEYFDEFDSIVQTLHYTKHDGFISHKHGIQFSYPNEWYFYISHQAGPHTNPGDMYLTYGNCTLQVTVPEQASEDKIQAKETNYLNNYSTQSELLSINELDILKYKYAVNAYGEEGDIYEVFLDETTTSTIILRSGNNNADCIDAHEMVVHSFQLYSNIETITVDKLPIYIDLPIDADLSFGEDEEGNVVIQYPSYEVDRADLLLIKKLGYLEKNQSVMDWVGENVDVNNKIEYSTFTLNSGDEYVKITGASSLEDFGRYAGFSGYFADINGNIYGMGMTQERLTIIDTRFSLQDIVLGIMNSISIKEADEMSYSTYTNHEYGFSFEYPREYSVKEKQDGKFVIEMFDSNYEFIFSVGLEDKHTAQNGFRECPYSTATEYYSTLECEILTTSIGDVYEARIDYPLEFGGWVLSSLFKKEINYQFTLSYFVSSRDLEIREQDFYKMFTQVSNTFIYSN